MPPRTNSRSLLTRPEQFLLGCAARILIGTQYNETHSEGNHDMFEMDLSVEMVRTMSRFINCLILIYSRTT
jgi:hypothetical protein